MKLTWQGLKEYVALTPTIFKQAPKILEATINQVKDQYGLLPEDEQAEIARRRLICAECPFNSSNAKKEMGYESSRVDEHCIMCGCTVARKTASLTSNCGISCCNAHPVNPCDCKKPNIKEFNVRNHIDMELKWKAYKTKENE